MNAGIPGAAAGLGGLAGGLVGSGMIGDATKAANKLYKQGRGYITDNNNQQRQDFQPFMQAGQDAVGNVQSTLSAGSGAANPTLSQAFNFDAWQNPATQYRIDQANAGINASALAKGGVGGGLAKSLAANSQNMASEEYANTYDRYLKQNQQDFGQQQQLFTNDQNQWQQQLAGWQNLANMGLDATGTTGNIGLGYTNAYNTNLNNQAQLGYQSATDRAAAIGGGLKSAFSGLSSLYGA